MKVCFWSYSDVLGTFNVNVGFGRPEDVRQTFQANVPWTFDPDQNLTKPNVQGTSWGRMCVCWVGHLTLHVTCFIKQVSV